MPHADPQLLEKSVYRGLCHSKHMALKLASSWGCTRSCVLLLWLRRAAWPAWGLHEVLRASYLAEEGRLACVAGCFLVAAESALSEMLTCLPHPTPPLWGLTGLRGSHQAS